MKKGTLLFWGLIIFSYVQAQNKTGGSTTPSRPKPATTTNAPLLQNGLDSLSYAIGLNIGQSMQMQGIENINYKVLNTAMEDMLKQRTPLMDQNTAMMTIQQKLQEYMLKKVNAQKEEGKKFLAQNKLQPGVVELPSGIQYKIISQGSGVKPTLADTVKVHYRGSLLNGSVFDDSYTRGTPIEFPLANLIEGWKQTLVLMPVGSKWTLYIPSDYGYGDRGAGANIPGGAMLIFDIELLDVKQAQQ